MALAYREGCVWPTILYIILSYCYSVTNNRQDLSVNSYVLRRGRLVITTLAVHCQKRKIGKFCILLL
jgi:hypothetical protein